MRIFKDIADAIYKPEAYNRFLQYRSGRRTSYVLLLPLFRILLVMSVAVIVFFSRYGSITDFIKKHSPDFTLSASGLDIKEKIDQLYGNVYVYIDTDKTMDEAKTYDKGANNVYVFKDALLIKDRFGKDSVLDFKDFGLAEDEVLTRDEFVNNVKLIIITTIIIIVIISAVFTYIGTTLAYICTAVLLLLAVKVVSKRMGKNLSDGQLLTTAIYAKTATFTLTTVLMAVNWVLNVYLNYIIEIPYFYAIKLIICLIYVYYIVLNIKEDKISVTSSEVKVREDIEKKELEVPAWEKYAKEKPLQPERLKPTDSWSFGDNKEDGNE